MADEQRQHQQQQRHGPESLGAGPTNLASAVAAPTVRRDQQSFLWSRVHVNPSHSETSVVPSPRSGAASVVVDNKLYVFGGYGGGTGRLDDFYSFDFLTSTWEQVEVLGNVKPGCRENNGVVISDSSRSIILFGGYNGSNWLNDLWKFDIDTKRWTCIQETGSSSGIDEANAGISFGGNPVAAAARKRPTPRFGYVSVVHNNKLILWGGFDGAGWMNDMYVFCFVTLTWSQIEQNGTLPSVRSCPAWAKDDKYVYIQGGYDGMERKDDFFACSLDTYTWQQMPSLGSTPSPRYYHSCVLYGNKLFMYGGYSGSQRLGDMYAYDFETNHWSPVDCSNGEAPSGRSSLVAQVYSNYLYVFGGYNGSFVTNDMFKCRLRPIGIPSPSLVSHFRRLINDSETSDICFLVEGEKVYAHKAVLAVRSDYFRAMLFNGHMRESSSSGDIPVEILDVSHSVFLQVLEFLYTDTLEGPVSLEDGINLMVASELFMLDRLKGICEDLIRSDITVENVISILVASHQHNAFGLKEIAMEHILQNLSEKPIQRGLTDLKTEPDLLVEILQLTSLQPITSSRQHSLGDCRGSGGK